MSSKVVIPDPFGNPDPLCIFGTFLKYNDKEKKMPFTKKLMRYKISPLIAGMLLIFLFLGGLVKNGFGEDTPVCDPCAEEPTCSPGSCTPSILHTCDCPGGAINTTALPCSANECGVIIEATCSGCGGHGSCSTCQPKCGDNGGDGDCPSCGDGGGGSGGAGGGDFGLGSVDARFSISAKFG